MRNTEIEPGLLPLFRVFTFLSMVVMVVFFLRLPTGENEHWRPPEPVAITIVGTLALQLYLCSPRLRRRLGRFYLPIALTFVSVSPILEQYFVIRSERAPGSHDFDDLIVILALPFLILSWQYPYKYVVLFCVGTGLAQVAVFVLATDFETFLNAHLFHRALFAQTVLFLVVGTVICRLMSKQREQRQALDQANRQLTQYAAALERMTIVQERNRMARELHDTVAHTLSGLAVHLEAIKTVWETDNARAYGMLDQALASTLSGLTETRRAIQSLRASPLEELGLLLALRSLGEITASRAGFMLELCLPSSVSQLTPEIELACYRIAQEALENIVKYAGARHVSVQLKQHNSGLELTIADDGAGFDIAGVDTNQHFGLTGMRERAAMIGGELQIDSQPTHGTTVRLVIGGPAA